MTKPRYLLDQDAKRDVRSNFHHIANDNLSAAQKYTRGLFAAMGSIAQLPNSGRLERTFSNLFDEEIRSFLYRNHRFYYCPQSDHIRVLRVLHTRQDQETIIQKHLKILRKLDIKR